AFAQRLVKGSLSQEQAVRRVLLALAAQITYDPDRLRRQDPSAVFESRRAFFVGFAGLALGLLRRRGIAAPALQGILGCGKAHDGYDPAVGGAYHRWIEVYYPDRGYVFSDPSSTINGVDARYIPFGHQSLAKPRSLSVTSLSASGSLSYEAVHAGE